MVAAYGQDPLKRGSWVEVEAVYFLEAVEGDFEVRRFSKLIS